MDKTPDRIVFFRLVIVDAWFNVDYGMDNQLVHSTDNQTSIDFIVGEKNHTIKLNNKEEDFIQDIINLNLNDINDFEYHQTWAMDGFQWFIKIVTNKIDICSCGSNSYPTELITLIDYLHVKWGLPYPKIYKHMKQSQYPNNGHEKTKLHSYQREDIGPLALWER